jgi:hypothetical protein
LVHIDGACKVETYRYACWVKGVGNFFFQVFVCNIFLFVI